jgi:hypothetical protein
MSHRIRQSDVEGPMSIGYSRPNSRRKRITTTVAPEPVAAPDDVRGLETG